jgi:reactive intermediate/imine deaminase
MAKKAIQTSKAPPPAGAYSQGIEINGFLYTSGLGPQDPTTGAVADTVSEQTRQVMSNIAAILAARGLKMDDCIKTTVHLADLADFKEFNEVYESFFNPPYPVRITVGSQLPGIRVEIEAVAAIPDGT